MVYHAMDSLRIENFIFDSGHWHRLDNIGVIQGFISQVVLFLELESHE
jgi:hypothetical protein